MKYVNLVIDNKSNMTDTFYTYGCEFDDVSVGDKVYVSFGKGKNLRIGYVLLTQIGRASCRERV